MGDTGEIFKAFNEMKAEQRAKKEPNRFKYACRKLDSIGYEYEINEPEIIVKMPNGKITFWPFTGWFCGQKPYGNIKGRGIENLISKLIEYRQ